MSSKSSSTSIVYYSVALFAVAFLTKYYINSSWHFQSPLYHRDFDELAPMNKRDIPTTYYSPGRLQDVLPRWHPESGSHIHLYRVKEGEKFVFDMEQVKDMSVVSRRMSYDNCTRIPSTLCGSCENFLEKRSLTIGEILNKTYGGDYFSSFTKLKESEMKNYEGLKLTDSVATSVIPENIYDKLFPTFAEKKYELIHAFASNFDHPRISTSIHCNALATSAAIQMIGSKTWLFYPPQVYLGKDGLESKPAKLSHFPTHSPRVPYDVYVYTSRPGDVLFFTNNWAHSVYSHEGPNFMINYRKLPEPSNFLPNPLAYLHMLGFFLLSPGLETSADINVKAKVLTSLACEGRLSKWDQQQVDLMLAEKSGADL